VSKTFHRGQFHFSDEELEKAAAAAYEDKRRRLSKQRDDRKFENGDPAQDAEAAWQARKLALQEHWQNKR
jgi:hypothetical protein